MRKLSNKKLTKTSAKQLVANHNRKVAKANKAFQALSPAEKRVHIARDVLAQLASNRLIPMKDQWLMPDSGFFFGEEDVKKTVELQSILNKLDRCHGCAIGGMFMCAVQIANDLKVNKLAGVRSFFKDKLMNEMSFWPLRDARIRGEDVFGYLSRFFTIGQLNKIEAAFEQGEGACEDEGAKRFAPGLEDPELRMRLIMENIIANEGTFKPEKQPQVTTTWTTPGFVG